MYNNVFNEFSEFNIEEEMDTFYSDEEEVYSDTDYLYADTDFLEENTDENSKSHIPYNSPVHMHLKGNKTFVFENFVNSLFMNFQEL